MNASYSSHTTAELGRSAVQFTRSRWCGGADGCGKYHVWGATYAADWDAKLFTPSQSAVVDDFGNLVRVPS